jgi:hypothetical protein
LPRPAGNWLPQAGSYTDGSWKEWAGKSPADLIAEWKAAIHRQLSKKSNPDDVVWRLDF